MDVYLEVGQKRVFAGALDWPGWNRSGRDEAAALAALVDYAPRYAAVVERVGLTLDPPADAEALRVVERLPGGSTTDFGAPEAIPDADQARMSGAQLAHFGALLTACWETFDAVAEAAIGVELRKGPRGGGRELEAITRHVLGAEQGYLSALGWKMPKHEAANLNEEMRLTRQAIMDGLAAAERGEIAERGPRGGVRWPPRYFVRRVAWHVLDHAWEIEDRAI
jgi:hypothetical protein